MQKKIINNDAFVQIAMSSHPRHDGNLIEPQSPTFKTKNLPLDCNLRAGFKVPEKMACAADLDVELAAYRKKYNKFMADFAPAVKSVVSKIPLHSFDWRIAEDTNSRQRRWKKVTIPHYGEPLGKAETIYRTTFVISKRQLKGTCAFICFKGVDYKAHVFINGNYVGSHEGFFAPFEFEFTRFAKPRRNTLVVRVENDFICGGNNASGQSFGGDKLYAATGLGYDEPMRGWHHCPPGMGIYQPVFIEFRPEIFIRDIFVRPLCGQNKAEAWIEVYSTAIEPKDIHFELSLYGQNFKKTVFKNRKYIPQTSHTCGTNDSFSECLAKANGTHNQPVRLTAEKGVNYFKIPFDIKHFRWWSNESPWLYQLQVTVRSSDPKGTHTACRQFGMRQFEMDTTSVPKGSLYLNGKPIRLRGANTMGHEQQCVFKGDFDKLIDDILLAKICNMNFLRLTQRPVQEKIYEYCDKLGLMTQTDLPLFGVLRRNQFCEALKQVGEMEKLVRSHPCNILISYINEPFPNAGNKPHRHLTKEELADFFASADRIVRQLNPERVIKACDGDYDPPSPGLPDMHCYCCWYNGHGIDIGKLNKGYWQRGIKKDWLYACGEFGAEGLERRELMEKYYPKSWLPNPQKESAWSPKQIVKCQTGNFHHFFFDTQHTLDDWIEASQDHQAWATRFMTEAFRRDNRMVSTAIHLFIDAFPSGWMKSIMDCERRPKKAYFAYRRALSPLLVSLRTDRLTFFEGQEIPIEVWLCNDLPKAPNGLNLHYQIEQNGKPLIAQKIPADVRVCASQYQGTLRFTAPRVSERTTLQIRAAVMDEKKHVLNDNVIEVEVFPNVQTPVLPVLVIGKKGGPASTLADELHLSAVTDASAKSIGVVLIDDYPAYRRQAKHIHRLAANGTRAVFLELPPGRYPIAGSEAEIKASGFGALHFVSRDTGHPMVSRFKPQDFRLWYQHDADRICPILNSSFTSADFDEILVTGNLDSDSQWSRAMAVGEKKYGRGSFVISQVSLAGRTNHNPAAKLFAVELLGISMNKKPGAE